MERVAGSRAVPCRWDWVRPPGTRVRAVPCMRKSVVGYAAAADASASLTDRLWRASPGPFLLDIAPWPVPQSPRVVPRRRRGASAVSDAAFRIVAHPHLGPLPAAETCPYHGGWRAARRPCGRAGCRCVARAWAAHLPHDRPDGRAARRLLRDGLCADCLMQIDGIPGVRACVTLVRAGMRVETQQGIGVWDAVATP